MVFNSLDFAVFFPLFFLLYWSLNGKRLIFQNLLIIAGSYIFYGLWDYRFLTLIFLSTVIDFLVGRMLETEGKRWKRKLLLISSIAFNLGMLGFFKYYNFFLENLRMAFTFFGQNLTIDSLSIVLPVGISFYTFQTMSYTIDVYRGKVPATKDFVGFASFVCFFPQLVAGPIERASQLLPQFKRRRYFSYSNSIVASQQILWGLFKKVVIADSCSPFVNQIFENSSDLSGSVLLLGAVLFAFQIYGDFSGYSDIAIGSARLLGFDLMRNFAFPYFSRDIAEFWRRWHISLSTWFRDYVYIPLGGSKGGTMMKVRNTFCIFLISGFWHGANWTFIFWGALHALFFLPLIINYKHRKYIEIVAQGKTFPKPRDLVKILSTFLLATLAWIPFRAESLQHTLQYFNGLFSQSLFQFPYLPEETTGNYIFPYRLILILGIFICVEWFGREGKFGLDKILFGIPGPAKIVIYNIILFTIFWFGGREEAFIYFQF